MALCLLAAVVQLVLIAAVSEPGAFAPHPRLVLDAARLSVVQGYVASNTQAQAYLAQLRLQGTYVLSTAPLPRPPANASDILTAARSVVTRIYVTALLYRLDGNETFAHRAIAELLSICSWSDWDLVKHALDAGELSHAAAVAFDWTYPVLSQDPANLAAAVAGISAKSSAVFKAAYETGAGGNTWWTCDPSNWAQVTNSGAAMAALALLGETGAPAYLPALLANATRGALCGAAEPRQAFGSGYSNDGAWFEGPIYSGYAMRLLVPFANALATATGDASLFALPGLALAPLYQTLVMDAQWRYFNWADASEEQETLIMLLSLAARNSSDVSARGAAFSLRARLDAAIAAGAITVGRIDTGNQACMEIPQALIYFTDMGAQADRSALPTAAALPVKKLALLRSSWSSNAAFVGLKATNCSWNHGDLDAGTFVFSSGGERIVEDLGAGNYDLPSYFSSKRFTYYAKSSLGHNTLSFGGAAQDWEGVCGVYGGAAPGRVGASAAAAGVPATFLDAFASAPGVHSLAYPAPDGHPLSSCTLGPGETACAVIGLSAAYATQVAHVTRRFGFVATNATFATLRVSDAWQPLPDAGPLSNATASLHTQAVVVVAADGQSATLTLGASAVLVTLTPPAAGAPCAGQLSLRATSVRLAPPQNPTPGLTRLDVVVADADGCNEVEVVITPTAGT